MNQHWEVEMGRVNRTHETRSDVGRGREALRRPQAKQDVKNLSLKKMEQVLLKLLS